MSETMEQLMKGIAILAKYPECAISVGHDTFYCGPSDCDEISAYDRERLEQLAWHYDSDVNCWARFV